MTPRVSVVVPMFNVATYLDDCLESLAQQSFGDLEVVMVDDGSTDDSAERAQRWAERDPRFRLVQKPNGGLGSARNAGVRDATGDYLAFVDSDDVVPRDGIETLVAALDKSGSDFASGNVRRLTSYGISQTLFLSDVFRGTRLRTHITEYPALLADRIACNKLFRRTFWDEHDLRFPEGVLYEDMPVTLPAHFLARSVDVVDRTVYLWRIREGGELSITQQRTDLRALRDRHAAVDSVSRFLATHGFDEPKRQYDTSVLRDDLRYFLDVLAGADDEFRACFFDLADDFIERADKAVAEPLPAIQRLKWHLVRRRMLPQLLEVLEFQETELDRCPPVVRRGSWYGDYPFLDDAEVGVPAETYRLDAELAALAVLDSLRWDGNALVVAGAAYIAQLGAAAPDAQQVSLHVEGPDGRIASVAATAVHRPDLTADNDAALASLDWAGFEARVPADHLPGAPKAPASVRIVVEVTVQGTSRTCTHPEWAPLHPPHTVVHETRGRSVRARIAPSGELEVAVVRNRVSADVCRWVDGVLQIEGTVHGGAQTGLRLSVARRVGTSELDYPVHVDSHVDPPTFLARVPVADLLGAVDVGDEAGHSEAHGDGVAWDVYLAGRARRRITQPVSMTEQVWSYRGREVALQRSRYGYLSIVDRLPRPVITGAEWSHDGELGLTGTFAAGGDTFELLVRRRRGSQEHTFAVDVDPAGAFVARIRVTGIASDVGGWSLAPGRWELSMRPVGAIDGVDVVLSHELLDRLPLSTNVGPRPVRFGVGGYDTPLLFVDRDLDETERGGINQSRLAAHYAAQRSEPLRDAVVFLCFDGTEYSDSPRAIHEELVRRGTDLEQLWVVRDGRVQVPDSATVIRADSADYYEALARARYIVANDYWPEVLDRRPDQVCVQTWHGLSVKAHGAMLADRHPARRTHRRARVQRPQNWELLLSPAPAVTPLLKQAFPDAATILEVGLPRADLLHRPDADEVRGAVRRRLGVEPAQRVAFYAPTYRDHLTQGRSRYRLGQMLDMFELQSVLGPEWVVLFRRHRDVVGRLTGPPGFVRDVSEYPSPADLLLASDVLVSDYSSYVADMASLGRPIVLFVPDLGSYRDDVRGLALPLDDAAPGPMLSATGEVAEALRDLEQTQQSHAERLAAFAATYCPLDDGAAAARVVDRVFGGPAALWPPH